MANMQQNKTAMPLLSLEKRRTTFEEVALGYSAEDAVNEAKRCLNCKNAPCKTGCPVGIDIPAFIARVAEGDFEGAYNIILKSNCLSAISGRVCPQERQCEKHCVRGIKGESVAIGRLERFVSDYMRAKEKAFPKVKKVGKRQKHDTKRLKQQKVFLGGNVGTAITSFCDNVEKTINV